MYEVPKYGTIHMVMGDHVAKRVWNSMAIIMHSTVMIVMLVLPLSPDVHKDKPGGPDTMHQMKWAVVHENVLKCCSGHGVA